LLVLKVMLIYFFYYYFYILYCPDRSEVDPILKGGYLTSKSRLKVYDEFTDGA